MLISRTLRRMPDRTRESTRDALDLYENAIASFIPEPGDAAGEKCFIAHPSAPSPTEAERARDGLSSNWLLPHLCAAFAGAFIM